jgi:RNA polymerase sigma-70 factor (ECF subfamily)
MIRKSTSPSLAELLQHAAWTRHLARGLAGDAAADDVVQETWVAALRRPPDTRQPLRPWLRSVVRNKVFNRSRDQARRASREARAGAGEAPESAENLIGRLELHKILVEVVSELAEPYRQMVLLAYFDELTSAEIGERHNIPAGTVRGRLKTALELLREALDRRLGSRAAWMPGIIELARPPSRLPPARHPHAAGGTAPASAGSTGLGFGSTLLPGVACAVAIAAAGTLWSIVRKPSPPRMESAPSAAAASSQTAGNDHATPLAATAVGRTGGARPGHITMAIGGVVVAGGPEAVSAIPRLGLGGGVSGAVVRVVGGLPARASPRTATTSLRIDRGQLSPRVQLLPAGTLLVVRNEDDTAHVVRAARGTLEVFRGSIPDHQLATVTIPGGAEPIRLEVLDAASAPAFVVPNESGLGGVTDPAGGFFIKGIPPGHYTLEVWDEALGRLTAEVTVPLAERALRFVFGSEPPPGVIWPCRIATRRDLPVVKACARGGQLAAMKVMKELVTKATALGERYTCADCHSDMSTYGLTPHAQDDLDKLLAAVKDPQRDGDRPARP